MSVFGLQRPKRPYRAPMSPTHLRILSMVWRTKWRCDWISSTDSQLQSVFRVWIQGNHCLCLIVSRFSVFIYVLLGFFKGLVRPSIYRSRYTGSAHFGFHFLVGQSFRLLRTKQYYWRLKGYVSMGGIGYKKRVFVYKV